MRLWNLFLLFAFTACNSQNQSTLTFFNKSSYLIDSIMIQLDKPVTIGQLKAGESYSHNFSNIEINSGREGQFSFKVFTHGKVFLGLWGFHDYGELAVNHEEF